MSDDFNDIEIDNKYDHLEDSKINDIKINPDFYTHICLLNALKSLEKDDITTGLLMFRMNIETLETLTRARGMLNGEDYDDKVSEFEEKINKDIKLSETTRQAKISNKKLELLTAIIFKGKILTSPLLDK